jgi:multidrug efflux pump subunit AcrA (membrane-fusion protein)
MSVSNARRAELENDLEDARAQLRGARTKDFNAGRLFRLEIENGKFQRELDLYKSALEEARQQILSNAQQMNVALPLEIENLRRDLGAAESALKSAEAARDAAVQELESLRYSFDLFKVSTQTQQRRLLNDNAFLRQLAMLPHFSNATASASIDAKNIVGVDFESIFTSKKRNHSVPSPQNCSSHLQHNETTLLETERQPASGFDHCDESPCDHHPQPPPTSAALSAIESTQSDSISMRSDVAAHAASPRTLLKDSSSFFPVHFASRP